MKKLLIATKNLAKAREIKSFFTASVGEKFDVVLLSDFPDSPDVEETGKTFKENAILKARKYFEWSGTSSIADDSGLEIDFLSGEPGVLSRRWPEPGEDPGNPGREKTDRELIDIALNKLNGVPLEKRTAHLTAVGAYYDGANIYVETASINGYIVEEQKIECEPGYPFRAIFWIPEFGKLYQDLTHEEHEKINHRKAVCIKLASDIMSLEK